VAVSDSRGATGDPEGLDVAALVAHKRSGKAVSDFGAGSPLERDALVAVDCDVLVPAARPDAIREEDVPRLRARMVVSGANISVTAAAEPLLHARGVLNVPDFIANAGGVICASVEYHGGSESQAMATIEEKIRHNTREVLERARERGCTPREAAVELAVQRVKRAMGYRRWSIF